MIDSQFDYEKAKQTILDMEKQLAEMTSNEMTRPWLAGARREAMGFHLQRLRAEVKDYDERGTKATTDADQEREIGT